MTQALTTLVGRATGAFERRWSADEAILYALSVGAGDDDPTKELEFTTEGTLEREQAVLPGFASVLGKPHPDCYSLLGDVERSAVLQSGYEVEWIGERPLPVAGQITSTTTLTELFTHRRGTLATLETCCFYTGSGEPAFVTRSKVLVRDLFIADAPEARRPQPATANEPDLQLQISTRPQQALLHRLLGDRNPLHSDPAVAARAGYDRPILHGLCTFGIAARALGVGRPRRMSARFTAAVVPGDRLTLSAWKAPSGYTFSMAAGERTVLDAGHLSFL